MKKGMETITVVTGMALALIVLVILTIFISKQFTEGGTQVADIKKQTNLPKPGECGPTLLERCMTSTECTTIKGTPLGPKNCPDTCCALP